MTGLRFLQVDTLYPAYLRHVYAGRPELRSASSQAQLVALMDDGHSAIHRVALHLGARGYESHWVPGNAVSLQARWLAENGLPHDGLGEADMADVVRERIDRIAPDVLYITDVQTYGSALIRALRRRPALVAGFHAALLLPGTDLSAYDLILSPLEGVRVAAVTVCGARSAAHFLPGFPSRLLEGGEPAARIHDVFFAGQCTPDQHPRRNRLLDLIARQADRFGYGCHFRLAGDTALLPSPLRERCLPPVYGRTMFRALCESRIAFDARGEITMGHAGSADAVDIAGRQTANMRIFEATGCGAMLLTEAFDNLAEFFRPGEEIETFRSEEELIDKIVYYIRHPDQRAAVARNGQRRCLRDHSMERRVVDFDRLIRDTLNGRPPTGNGRQ